MMDTVDYEEVCEVFGVDMTAVLRRKLSSAQSAVSRADATCEQLIALLDETGGVNWKRAIRQACIANIGTIEPGEYAAACACLGLKLSDEFSTFIENHLNDDEFFVTHPYPCQ